MSATGAASWQFVVAVSALISTALLALSFNRQLLIGLGIDVGLLWVALAGRWSP